MDPPKPTYYELNRERCLARQKEYNKNNKEKVQQYQQYYWYKHREKKLAERKLKPRVYHPKPKKEKKAKPPKAPVLPSVETIIDQLAQPEPIPQNTMEIIRGPITVSFT